MDMTTGFVPRSTARVRKFPHADVEANPAISIHHLYYQLATHTTASHAGLYNDSCYGNVYRNTLEEFLIPGVN